jgi:hypothetical protein
MPLTAKLIQILPVQSGSSANGGWKKMNFIVETTGQYPKKACFMLWGDKVDSFKYDIGQMLTVEYDIESREYNDRWYTDLKVWKVTPEGDLVQSQTSQPSINNDAPVQPPQAFENPSVDDDLPF